MAGAVAPERTAVSSRAAATQAKTAAPTTTTVSSKAASAVQMAPVLQAGAVAWAARAFLLEASAAQQAITARPGMSASFTTASRSAALIRPARRV